MKMESQLNALPECSIIVHDDITDAENVKETICPLCSTPLKLYQIHYDEKFLMCGNTQCPYPFGVTDYHIYKIECNEKFVKTDCSSSGMSMTTGSTISKSDRSKMDRIMDNTDKSAIPTPPTRIEKLQEMQKIEELKQSYKEEAIIKRNVRRIKQLNKQLSRYEELDSISNDQWIKQLAQMQERSGVQVLKEEELKKVKKFSELGLGELKLNINSSAGGISVKIDVTDEDKQKKQNEHKQQNVQCEGAHADTVLPY